MTPVGVVAGPDAPADLADRVRGALRTAADAGATEAETDTPDLETGAAAAVLAADPDAVVTVGEPALLAAVREGVDVPVLPVAAGPGYGGIRASRADAGSSDDLRESDGVAGQDLTSAMGALLAGEYETVQRATLAVSVGDDRVGRALADVMLVTAEPARISEYAVRSGGERIEGFRADGVVVSTPTGSHGYGRSAGGPLLEPGSGVVCVVPVAPFAVNVDHWVLGADQPVTLTVERDEGEVSLLLDDRTVRAVPPNEPVEVVEDGALSVVRVPESQPFFER